LSPQAGVALYEDLPRAATLDTAMAIVEEVRLAQLGPGLLTVNLNATLAVDGIDAGSADVIELQRIWSSDAAAYPVAGRKRKTMTPWTRQLLRDAEVFVGEGAQALAQAFDDHTHIAALGWQAIINVPVLDSRGRCFATFNVLGPSARWQPEEIELVRLLARLATPALRQAAQTFAAAAAATKEAGQPS
jgi:GAF domain-containing protein